MNGSKAKTRGAPQRRPDARPVRPSAKTPAVLVADDAASMLRLAVMLLKDLLPHASVRTASDGFEAARVLRAMKPDLFITDLFMPGPDGVQLSAMARFDPQLRGLKILAMTGQDSSETRKDALRAGADEYLAKPFDPEEFRAAVLRLLGIEERRPRAARAAPGQAPPAADEDVAEEDEGGDEGVAELGQPERAEPPYEEEDDI